MENIPKIQHTDVYYIGTHSANDSFESSTIGSIKDTFKAVGQVIGPGIN